MSDAVKVKPLEWTHFPAKKFQLETWEADSSLGTYAIEYEPDEDKDVAYTLIDDNYPETFGSLAEAQGYAWEQHKRAILDAIATLGPWQPIETAPKDGQFVILAAQFDLDGEPYSIVTFGHWLDGYGDASDEMGINSGWNDHHYTEFDPGRDFGNPDYMRTPRQPTHWMPLPTPPAQEGAGDE